MPLVSALIPTYNRAEHVVGAVETVLAQTHEEVEAVVVDDGSDDATREALARFEDDDRVRVRHNERNRGIAYSFNRAADLARGEYYCILGDDDRWHPEKVERQLARFAALDDSYGVVYTGGELTNGDAVTMRYAPEWEGNIYPDILGSFELHPHSGHMIRREAFEAVGGFDESFPRGVDWEMCVRLAKEYKFAYVPGSLVERRRHGGNISAQPEQLQVHRLMWEKYGEEYRRYPAVARRFRAKWNRGRSFRALEDGDRVAAIRFGAAAVRERPAPYNLFVLLVALCGPRAHDAARRTRRAAVNARTGGPIARR